MIFLLIKTILFPLAPLLGWLAGKRMKKKSVFITGVAAVLVSVLLLFPVVVMNFTYGYEVIPVLGTLSGLLGLTFLLMAGIKRERPRKTVIYGYTGVLLLLSIYTGASGISEAVLRTEAVTTETWSVLPYRITCYRTVRWTGPPLKRYELEEAKLYGLLYKRLAIKTDNDNDCFINFEAQHGKRIFIFNECDITLKIK